MTDEFDKKINNNYCMQLLFIGMASLKELLLYTWMLSLEYNYVNRIYVSRVWQLYLFDNWRLPYTYISIFQNYNVPEKLICFAILLISVSCSMVILFNNAILPFGLPKLLGTLWIFLLSICRSLSNLALVQGTTRLKIFFYYFPERKTF